MNKIYLDVELESLKKGDTEPSYVTIKDHQMKMNIKNAKELDKIFELINKGKMTNIFEVDIEVQPKEEEIIHYDLSDIFDDSEDLDEEDLIELSDEYYKRKKQEQKKYFANLKNKIYIFKKLSIKELNKNSIEFLKRFGSKFETIDFGNLNLKDISTIISSIPFSQNTFFITKYSSHAPSPMQNLIEAIEYVYHIRDYVLQFGFSPLEQTIFLYDLIRERKYKYSDFQLNAGKYLSKLSDSKFIEKNIEGYSDKEEAKIKQKEFVASYKEQLIARSRSLFEIYKSDEIVCAGFAVLYQAVLESLGIKCDNVIYYSTKEGHASTIIYLKDKKYDEDIILEVDPTWGRIESKDGKYDYQKSIKNYSNFGLSLVGGFNKKNNDKSFEVLTNYSQQYNALYSLVKDDINSITEYENYLFEVESEMRLPKIGEDNKISNPLRASSFKRLHSLLKSIATSCDTEIFNEEINYIEEKFSNYLGEIGPFTLKIFCEERDNLIDEYYEILLTIKEKFEKDLDQENFLMALTRVREAENFINPDMFDMSSESIYRSYLTKYRIPSSEELLLQRIMGIASTGETAKIDFKNYQELRENNPGYNTSLLEGMRLESNPVLHLKK